MGFLIIWCRKPSSREGRRDGRLGRSAVPNRAYGRPTRSQAGLALQQVRMVKGRAKWGDMMEGSGAESPGLTIQQALCIVGLTEKIELPLHRIPKLPRRLAFVDRRFGIRRPDILDSRQEKKATNQPREDNQWIRLTKLCTVMVSDLLLIGVRPTSWTWIIILNHEYGS